MIDLIIFSISLIIIFMLTYFLIKRTNQARKLLMAGLQLNYENDLLKKEIEKIIENHKLEQSDGFLKFISDSRDWAFHYIEEVQYALKEFDEIIVPIAEWNRSYGTILGENLYSSKIEEISLAYERLQSLLPKDNETPNN